MTTYYEDATVQLHHGDCLDVLRSLPDNSVDSVVTDPPAGIGFMGRGWDHNKGGRDQWSAWLAEVMRECYRVAKPGAHAFVWALPRTSHWTACGIEDAGWEIRDRVVHLFGTGFPKSHNLPGGLGTALKPAAEDWWLARKPLTGTVASNVLAWGTGALNVDGCRVGTEERTYTPKGIKPGSHNAVGADWDGGGQESVAAGGRWPANVVLDESQAARLDEMSGFTTMETYGDQGGASRFFYVAREDESCPTPEPANTVGPASSPPSAPGASAPSGAATSERPATASQTASPSTNAMPSGSRPSGETDTPTTPTIGDESSPEQQPAKPSQMVSRARYAASLEPTATTTTTKSPSTSAGSADPATSSTTPSSGLGVPLAELGSRFTYVAKADAGERVRVAGVAHPTVKPLALMRWLVRLVTPPGGTVLEPFAGSGTTVEACILEGFHCVAIEREADYLPLIVQRINRRRDPVAAVIAQGDDAGLFDLLDGEPA